MSNRGSWVQGELSLPGAKPRKQVPLSFQARRAGPRGAQEAATAARHVQAFVVRNQHGRAQHSSNDARVVRTRSVEGVVLEREWSPPGA